MHLFISLICASVMPCVVNSSISNVSPSIAMLGVNSPDIVTVDLQSDKYLQHSVIQLLVSIVDSYLAKSASKISVACRIPAGCIPVASAIGRPLDPGVSSFQYSTVGVLTFVLKTGDADLACRTYMFRAPHYFPCFCLLPFSKGSH
jgi:hypothetical protein